MQIERITYTRRKNLGDFSYHEVTLEAALEKEDKVDSAFALLRATAREQLEEGMGGVEVHTEKPVKEAKVAPVTEAVAEPAEPPMPAEEEEKPKKVKKSKKAKTTTIAYDRKDEDHKVRFREKLTELYPNWKKDKEGIGMRIKAFSKKAHKAEMPFISKDDGEILPSFIEELKAFVEE